MTPAERRLLDLALRHDLGSCEASELIEAREAVLRQDLPEEFEATLLDLAQRERAAVIAVTAYAGKHALGGEMLSRIRKELRGAAR